MIRVVVFPVSGNPEVREIEPTLPAMQAVIGGGYLEHVSVLRDGIGLFCDEDGLGKGLPRNEHPFLGRVYVGPFFVSKADARGETIGLTDSDIDAILPCAFPVRP